MRLFPTISRKDITSKKPLLRENHWNALTLVALLTTLAAVVVLLVIFTNPAAGINPYPPSSKPPKAVVPLATATATNLPPTAAPTWTPTLEPTVVVPTDESAVVKPSPTIEVVVVAGTPATVPSSLPPAEPPKPGKFAFGLQAQPQGIAASLYEPTRGCAWMGVAGRVWDIQNRPVKGIRVAITGGLAGHTVNLLSLSGTALQYGPSGYEFTLAEAPQATIGLLKIQLLDQSDLPLSDFVVLDTYVECEKNLILVDFKQINE